MRLGREAGWHCHTCLSSGPGLDSCTHNEEGHVNKILLVQSTVTVAENIFLASQDWPGLLHGLARSLISSAGLPSGPPPQHTFTSGGYLLSLDHNLVQPLISRGNAVAKELAQSQGADTHFIHTKEERLQEEGKPHTAEASVSGGTVQCSHAWQPTLS